MFEFLFLLHMFDGFWIIGLWCWTSLAAQVVGYFNIDRLWNWTSVPDSWYGWATLGTDSRMTSPVLVFVIMFLCLHLEMLDREVILKLRVCKIELLFLIYGMDEWLEEQIAEWLHLRSSLWMCSFGSEVVECLDLFLSGALVNDYLYLSLSSCSCD